MSETILHACGHRQDVDWPEHGTVRCAGCGWAIRRDTPQYQTLSPEYEEGK